MRFFNSLLTSAALLFTLAAPTAADAACSDPSNLCAEPKLAKWEPGASLSAKQLKAKRKGANGTLSLKIDDGRGSVFIDGRFLGVAPLTNVELGPGKHDIQVRDGSKILAEGVITIPKGSAVKATVTHP